MLIPAVGFFWVFGCGVLGLLILGCWIAGLVDVTGRPDLDRRGRASWIALIVLLPVVGTLIYWAKRPTLPEERDKIIAAQMRHHR